MGQPMFNVKVSEYAKIFGVIFDNRMNLQKHITTCVGRLICAGRCMKINGIRRYISDTAVRTFVQLIVIAGLDYCNYVCIGLPMNRLQRLQPVQNSAARVISQTKRCTSISPLLDEPHHRSTNGVS